jgi:hypothetical protein
MAKPQIILEVTNKKVGYSWMKSWKNPLDQNLYLVPTYQMNLYVQCPGKERRQVGAFEVIRFVKGSSRLLAHIKLRFDALHLTNESRACLTPCMSRSGGIGKIPHDKK